MTEIEKAKTLWRICGNMAIYLSVSDRAQIANSFKAMIEKAEQAEGFEAFKREVSDAVEKLINSVGHDGIALGRVTHYLADFILPKPVDPLVAVMDDFMSMDGGCLEECVEQFRVALARRGLEVREIEG